MSRPVILITAADLAPAALALLTDFDIVYAGKTPQPTDIEALARLGADIAITVGEAVEGERGVALVRGVEDDD